MNNEPRRFSLSREQIPIVLEHPETGKETNYILLEMTGRGRDEHLNNLNSRLRADGTMKNLLGVQPSLIAACLFRMNEDGSRGEQVKIGEIEKWPGSVQTELYKMCQELNGLGTSDDAQEEMGND